MSKTLQELQVELGIVEKIFPDYTTPQLPELPFTVYRYNCKNGRFYGIENRKGLKPSVTTIMKAISKGIAYEIWLGNASSHKDAMDYSMTAADSGTKVHKKCSERIVNGSVIFPEDEKWEDEEFIKYLGFELFMEEKQPEVLATEYIGYSPNFPIAGAIDLPCIMNGEYCIIDIKTGKEWNSYPYQLFAYKDLINQVLADMGSSIRFTKTYCLYLKEGTKCARALAEAQTEEEMTDAYKLASYTLKEYKEKDYKSSWMDIYNLFCDLEGVEPKHRVVVPVTIPRVKKVEVEEDAL